MHEMSIATNLIAMIKHEMATHNATHLIRIRLRCGAMANIVPDSLTFAFEVLTAETSLSGAIVEVIEEPLCLICCDCGCEFSPDSSNLAKLFPCPQCGEDLGHKIVSGKELYLDLLEVE